ncbi:MAG: hypothetical protein H0Z19_07825 [Archaeoglobus sp.]|uniref:hypothetical protein n=1 Tax=Archaeoglobus sp. TaxID=1872626 RepID=UPI001E177CBB|nr:hypothetical protein [Archaeoglobus sp.]MBO8180372.1 hypothetical protein [Archaeoglobus sp.]
MANAADFANVLMQLVLTNFELLMNSFRLLLNNSVDVAAIWNVSIHAAGFGYWFTKPFVGDGGSLDVASRNVSAMKNISYAINYIGGNAETIFGNETGQKGLSAVMRHFVEMIDEDFAVKVWEMARTGVEVGMRMLENINATLR